MFGVKPNLPLLAKIADLARNPKRISEAAVDFSMSTYGTQRRYSETSCQTSACMIGSAALCGIFEIAPYWVKDYSPDPDNYHIYILSNIFEYRRELGLEYSETWYWLFSEPPVMKIKLKHMAILIDTYIRLFKEAGGFEPPRDELYAAAYLAGATSIEI